MPKLWYGSLHKRTQVKQKEVHINTYIVFLYINGYTNRYGYMVYANGCSCQQWIHSQTYIQTVSVNLCNTNLVGVWLALTETNTILGQTLVGHSKQLITKLLLKMVVMIP